MFMFVTNLDELLGNLPDESEDFADFEELDLNGNPIQQDEYDEDGFLIGEEIVEDIDFEEL